MFALEAHWARCGEARTKIGNNFHSENFKVISSYEYNFIARGVNFVIFDDANKKIKLIRILSDLYRIDKYFFMQIITREISDCAVKIGLIKVFFGILFKIFS